MKPCFLLWLALLGLAGQPAAGQLPGSLTGNVLSASDIHFGVKKGLYNQLAGQPFQQWEAQLQLADNTPLVLPASPRQDANYWLLTTSLNAMHAQCPKPDFIVITGDFISHALTKSWSADKASFMELDSVYQYLAWKISYHFPGTIVVPGLGNNDTDTGDDNPPSPAFLRMFARVWAPLLYPASPPAQATFITDFGQRGYYKYHLPGPASHQLFMLNTVLFFSKDTTSANPNGPTCVLRRPEATAELKWLSDSLAATASTDKLWMAMHVPYGIDVFQTITPYSQALGCQDTLIGKQRVHAMWHASATRVYSALMAQYAGRLVAGVAGHTHMNEFRVLTDQAAKPVAFLHVTPSVSPYFGNNPGFQVLRYDPATLALLNTHTYFVNLKPTPQNPNQWHLEYSFQDAYGVAGMGLNLASLQAVQAKLVQFDTTTASNIYQWRYRTFFTDSAAVSLTPPSPAIRQNWKYYWCTTAATTPTQYCHCLQNWPPPTTTTAGAQPKARPARKRQRRVAAR